VPDLCFAIPGDIETRTGGYLYDRRLIFELRRLGWAVQHLSWGASFPFPSPADLAGAARSLAQLQAGSVVLIDGLAYGAMPVQAELEARRLRLVSLVHHPLALESGLAPDRQEMLFESERRALQAARAVICTSATTAWTIRDNYGIVPAAVFIARPGTDALLPATTPVWGAGGAVHLLSIATVTYRKGHDVLVEALARVADLNWTCTIVGSLEREPVAAALVRQLIAHHGLGGRIRLVGEVAEVSDLYRRADVFVLASRYEGYGMVFAEALGYGLPVIATTGGAIPEVVPPTSGILVPPDDVSALAEALHRMISNPAARHQFAAGARAAAEALPRWEEAARDVAAALELVSNS